MRTIRLSARWLVSIISAVVFTLLAAGVISPVSVTGLPTDRRPTPTWPGPVPSQRPPIVVLSVGDSLTVGHGPNGTFTQSYRPDLSRLLGMTGQPHTWKVEALGGTKCSYWAARIDQIITAHQPHLMFLNCGTNDTPTDNTETDYRTILTRAAARGVPLVASKIGVPDMRSPTNVVRPWIDDWHENTNQAIGRALAAFPSVPWADITLIPANPEWLQVDGIHWIARTEAAVAELFYRAAQPGRGWLTLAQMGQQGMCGLYGNPAPAAPWPTPDVAYRVCRA